MNVLLWQVEVERRNNFIFTKVFEGLACESFNNLILWVQYKFSTTREEVRLDFKGVALTLYLLATIVIKCFILQPWINCAGNLFKYRWTWISLNIDYNLKRFNRRIIEATPRHDSWLSDHFSGNIGHCIIWCLTTPDSPGGGGRVLMVTCVCSSRDSG